MNPGRLRSVLRSVFLVTQTVLFSLHLRPGRRIDRIFGTPDLEVGRAWVVQTRASDHLPVLAEIAAGR